MRNEQEQDEQFDDTVIIKVQKQEGGYSITTAAGWSFWVKDKHGVEPKVADTARFYGRGIGSVVRGLMINDQTLYYHTEAEQEAIHARQIAESDAKKRAEYQANKDALCARIEALPLNFRSRIEGFMERNPNFGWEYLPYELFTCEEAVKIYNALQTPEKISEFRDMDWEEQKKLVQLDDGHSGNTFGAACNLAMLHAQEINVSLQHGALCPLVGCVSYGCPQAEEA